MEILDVDSSVVIMLGDVLLHPILGVAVVAADTLKHIVGDGEHELDPGPGEGTDRPGVGVEQLDLRDPVGLDHLDDGGGEQGVGHYGSPVHAEGRRG